MDQRQKCTREENPLAEAKNELGLPRFGSELITISQMQKHLKRTCDRKCLTQEKRQCIRSMHRGLRLQRKHACDQKSVFENDSAELLK